MKVSFEKREIADYPDINNSFNPSLLYPEYLWGTEEVSNNANPVYDMIRQNLYLLGLDKENFGSKSWNPLGDIIKQGDNVLIKPNMVNSNHPQLECIISNPSIVRAVVDYVCIALKGTGKIIIGDAPMQRCQFKELTERIGYDKLISFYNNKGIDIEIVDFRNCVMDDSDHQVTVTEKNEDNFICCDIAKDSFLVESDSKFKRYRVTNYDYRKMRDYHNRTHHKYLIRKEVIQADVIISIPKIKTHRKAGYTGALKNFVGTIVHKECLPHHTRGSMTMRGDEYKYANPLKALRTFLYEQIDLANIYNKKKGIPILRFFLVFAERALRYFERDPYSEGSWYGNDTIWRTIGDINRIILYSDKEGKLQNSIQRKTLIIGDMIISGEGEGPLEALPFYGGIIVAGLNPVAVDLLIVKIMGFDYMKIPLLRNLLGKKYKFPLLNNSYNDVIVYSNSLDAGKNKLTEISFDSNHIPASGWKNHIEMKAE